VILVDTSIWIDHLRKPDQRLQELLHNSEVLMHPVVLMEIALGSISNREKVIDHLALLPQAQVAEWNELLDLVEKRALYRKGIGIADLHLLASALLSSSVLLWTRDRRLSEVAASLGILT
jgi:predicted nucleic acid-binding protein